MQKRVNLVYLNICWKMNLWLQKIGFDAAENGPSKIQATDHLPDPPRPHRSNKRAWLLIGRTGPYDRERFAEFSLEALLE